MTATTDVLIIGGGIIGGSVAFHLLDRDPRLRVTLPLSLDRFGAGRLRAEANMFSPGLFMNVRRERRC